MTTQDPSSEVREMSGEVSTTNPSRRIIEPILDASGTLRRVPPAPGKPSSIDESRSAAHPARS